MKSYIYLSTAVLLLSSFILPVESAIAGPRKVKSVRASEKQELVVLLRTVEGVSDPAVKKARIDRRIMDLRLKLQPLQYNSYKLLSSQSFRVPVRKKHIVRLADGDTLIMRLHYKDERRIGLWLKWRDKDGMEVLDTRIHFSPGESMVTGVERAANEGIILAIGVSEL